ncbi:MAG: hypothetical protein R3A11_08615 [Bdellovibrionota bacterium]
MKSWVQVVVGCVLFLMVGCDHEPKVIVHLMEISSSKEYIADSVVAELLATGELTDELQKQNPSLGKALRDYLDQQIAQISHLDREPDQDMDAQQWKQLAISLEQARTWSWNMVEFLRPYEVTEKEYLEKLEAMEEDLIIPVIITFSSSNKWKSNRFLLIQQWGEIAMGYSVLVAIAYERYALVSENISTQELAKTTSAQWQQVLNDLSLYEKAIEGLETNSSHHAVLSRSQEWITAHMQWLQRGYEMQR